MTDRYFGKVVSIQDDFTIVINKGANDDVMVNQKFLVVGQGDIIVDPETGEELERLELVRGRVSVEHVQQKISTLKSCLYEQKEGRKEIKKVTANSSFAVFGPEKTVTESITPGERHLKELNDVQVGDYVIRN